MKFINKFSTLALVIVISGCNPRAGSLGWTYMAEDIEIRNYYDSKSLYEICRTWDWAWDKRRIRSFVKLSLKRRGVDPYYCYNPELDTLRQLQKDVNELKSRPVYKPPSQTDLLIQKMRQGKVY